MLHSRESTGESHYSIAEARGFWNYRLYYQEFCDWLLALAISKLESWLESIGRATITKSGKQIRDFTLLALQEKEGSIMGK